MEKIEQIICSFCGENNLPTNKKCWFCKSVLKKETKSEDFKQKIDNKSGKRKKPIFKIVLLFVYLIFFGLWVYYEYEAYGFKIRADAWLGEGKYTSAKMAYGFLIQKFPFSYSSMNSRSIFSNEERRILGNDFRDGSEILSKPEFEWFNPYIHHSFPLLAGAVCCVVFGLLFLIRLLSIKFCFGFLLLCGVCAIFLVVQLAWADLIDSEPLKNLSRGLMRNPQTIYITGYVLVFLMCVSTFSLKKD